MYMPKVQNTFKKIRLLDIKHAHLMNVLLYESTPGLSQM